MKPIFVLIFALLLPTPVLCQDSRIAEALDPVEDALSIVVFDNWSGFSWSAPINHSYYFYRDGDSFCGFATVSTGTGSNQRGEIVKGLKLSVESMNSLFEELKKEEFLKQKYEPNDPVTDTYPDITITLDFGDKFFSLRSRSQGEHAIPWEVTRGRASLVTDSKVPMKILLKFRALLPKEIPSQ